MELLQSRVLLNPSDFKAALRRCEEFGLHTLRIYGPLEEPLGVLFSLGGGGILELSSLERIPPSGVRLWVQVPSMSRALEELKNRQYPGNMGEPVHQPWGLLECEVELFEGVVVILVEVPKEHPLHWRGD